MYLCEYQVFQQSVNFLNVTRWNVVRDGVGLGEFWG